ncbi:MAG: DoxX family protein [Vicinamibacterales bacterium]
MNRQTAEDVAYFLLRIVTALLFIQAGGMKLFGWFGGMPGGATAPVMSQIWIAGVLEVFGGLAIMLGLFTRPVAFILSGQMAVAYWQFHAPNGRWPIQNHGEMAVLMCFIFLYLSAKGAGPWSLDALMRRRRR